jgi:hypothetical protein
MSALPKRLRWCVAKSQSKPAYNPFAELAHVREEKAHPATQAFQGLDSQSLNRSVAKSQNPAFVKLTAYVPKDLHRAAKARLVHEGREISELVEKLVRDWLKGESIDSTT